MALTKAVLVERISEKFAPLEKEAAKIIVDTFFDSMKAVFINDEELKITHFGNFKTRKKAARPGCNPKTKEKVTVAARRVLTFKPSRLLKKMIIEAKNASSSE